MFTKIITTDIPTTNEEVTPVYLQYCPISSDARRLNPLFSNKLRPPFTRKTACNVELFNDKCTACGRKEIIYTTLHVLRTYAADIHELYITNSIPRSSAIQKYVPRADDENSMEVVLLRNVEARCIIHWTERFNFIPGILISLEADSLAITDYILAGTLFRWKEFFYTTLRTDHPDPSLLHLHSEMAALHDPFFYGVN